MRLLKLKILSSRYSYEWLPLFALLVGLLMTYALWTNEKKNTDKALEYRYEYILKAAENTVLKQIANFHQAMLGVQSFFRASNYVTSNEFNLYVSNLLREQRELGLKSVGFARYVDTHKPETYADLGSNVMHMLIHDKPITKHQFAPIAYLEPKLEEVSPLAIDAFADLATREAMELSTKTNDFVMSSNWNMDIFGQVCDCLVIYLPVFINNTAVDTMLQREQNSYGWIFFRISFTELLKNSLKPLEDGNVQFYVYDITQANAKEIYKTELNEQFMRSKKPKYSKEHGIRTSYHHWRLLVNSTIAFERKETYKHANQIGLFGLFLSVVFSAGIYLISARLRTLQLIQKVSKKLYFSEQRWKFALEGAGDGVWDWDVETGVVELSKQWKAMLGYEESEIQNNIDEWKSRVHPEDYANVINAVNLTLAGNKETYAYEYRMRCKNGSWKWILDRGMVVGRDQHGKALRMVGTHADISGLKKSEEAIWQHANFDLLTGLPNRRMFYARLDQEIQKAKRSGLKVALIFLDLDGFKEVNDTLGHDQGDLLLKLTANRLSECMRGSDAVARLGGDEFILIIGDIANAELGRIETVAQKVIDALSEPFQLSQETAYVTASLGIVIYPDDAMRIEDLMKSVDQAMYASKQKGGGCYTYFTPRMQEIALYRKQLSNDLRLALARRELFLEYQPIVDLMSGDIYKAEALLRWKHPTRGLVPPAEFIPIAEDTRLIHDIGNWVFQEAMEQAMKWRQSLHPCFQVTVNKSPIQFQIEGVRQSTWVDVMQAHRVPGDAVIVEITESLLLDASSKVQERLAQFQKLGIQVAIDDFGTGYSSLSYLKKFDIDYLKIDKSFVANLAEQSDDLVLCEAIIAMAHRLGIKVIAEGIENDLQRTLLTRAGCDFGQGYYYAASVSAEMFESLIKGGKQRIDSHTKVG